MYPRFENRGIIAPPHPLFFLTPKPLPVFALHGLTPSIGLLFPLFHHGIQVRLAQPALLKSTLHSLDNGLQKTGKVFTGVDRTRSNCQKTCLWGLPNPGTDSSYLHPKQYNSIMKPVPYPPAHPWTKKKLEFLKKYLPAFVKATQKAFSRYYVDGFAGPGYNQEEDGTLVEGSPLLAVKHDFTGFFFVEKKGENYDLLIKSLKEAGAPMKAIQCYCGDFNEYVDEILSHIHPRSPTVFFLDPFGLELKWSTVEKITKREKADVFILISSGAGRVKNKHPEVLDRFFGDGSWRSIRPKPGESWFEAFTEAYRDRMRNLGLQGTELVIVARNEKNAPLYVLAFHSKHPVALKIADQVFKGIRKNPNLPPLLDP